MEAEPLRKQFDIAVRHGVLKIIILVHLRKRGMHPYAILKHFKDSRHPMLSRMKKSEIYNTIKSLEDDGFVKYKIIKKGAQLQKYYWLTPKGKKLLKRAKMISMNALAELRMLIKSEFK